MAFSPLGLVLGAALARDVKDRDKASQIEVLGGVMGTSPLGLVLVATLAKQASSTTAPPSGGPTEAAVPDLRIAGDDLEAAARLLEANGLVAGKTVQVISDAPSGMILGSTPEQGALVPIKTVVTINVSVGMIVPTVTKLPVRDAEEKLGEAGFTSEVKVTDMPGDPGVVVKQDPAGGDFASVGATVTLYVKQHRPSTD